MISPNGIAHIQLSVRDVAASRPFYYKLLHETFGMAIQYDVPGQIFPHVAVETPVKLTEHQRKLLKELDESLRKGGERHSPNEKSWADRVKDLFK